MKHEWCLIKSSIHYSVCVFIVFPIGSGVQRYLFVCGSMLTNRLRDLSASNGQIKIDVPTVHDVCNRNVFIVTWLSAQVQQCTSERFEYYHHMLPHIVNNQCRRTHTYHVWNAAHSTQCIHLFNWMMHCRVECDTELSK